MAFMFLLSCSRLIGGGSLTRVTLTTFHRLQLCAVTLRRVVKKGNMTNLTKSPQISLNLTKATKTEAHRA